MDDKDENLTDELKRLRDERQKKFNEQDWQGALEIHDQILQISPSALRYANRGSILYRMGRVEEAIGSYRKALEMDPNLKRAKADLERLETQLQKQPKKSSAHTTPIPSITPNTASYTAEDTRQAMLNELRDDRQKKMDNHDWAGALEIHNQILELDPTALRYANKGSILYRLGRIREAMESYQKALDMDPSLEEARTDLEKLESQIEEEQLLGQEKAKENKDSNKNLQKEIEELRKKRQEKIDAEDWQGALEIHDQLLAMDPTALRYVNRGSFLYRMGRLQEALESYRKALELDPTLEKARQDMSALEDMMAEESLLPGKAEDQISPEERAAKIAQLRDDRQKYIDAKEWQKALEMHDKIIELDPAPLRYVNRGSMCYRMGELEKAIESYRIALQMDPNLGRAQNDLARLEAELAKKKVQASAGEKDMIIPPAQAELAKSEEPQASEREKEEIENKKIEAKLEDLRLQRQQMIDAENWEGALKVLDQMIELEPNSAIRYANRGSILYRLSRVHEAILSYGKALELDANLERAREDLERIKETEMEHLRQLRQELMAKEDWEATLKIHDVIMVLEPSALRHANRGSILYRLGRLQEAAQSYYKALELDPELQNAKEDLVQIEEELKAVQQAKTVPAVPVEFEEEDEEDIFVADEVGSAALELEYPHVVESKEEKVFLPVQPAKTCVAIWTEHEKGITQLCSTEDGKFLVSASKDSNLKVWDVKRQQCVHTLKGHQDWVRSLTITHNNDKIVSGSDDWFIRVWDVQSGKCDHTFSGHAMPVISLCISKNDRFVLSGSRDHSIKIWDLKNGKHLNTLKGHDDWVSCITIVPEGNKAISGGYDSKIRIWNVLGWRCMQILEGHTGWIEKLLVTPDGKYIISSSKDRTVRIWSISNGEPLANLQSHNDQITDMYLSDDGSLLASAGRDQCVYLWEIPSGKMKSVLRGELARFEKVLITPDKHFVIAASGNNRLWLWDIQGEPQLVESWDDTSGISCFTLIPNENLLVSGNRQGMIKLWDLGIVKKPASL